MSDFFSPLEEDDVRRTRQDEDEERLAKEALDAVGDRARVFALWNEETRSAIERGALNPSTLVVATTPWACGLVFDTVEAGALSLRPMGAITVAGVSARGVAASGTIGREDPVGTLFRVDDDSDACVLTVNHDVPADRAREYAETLCSSVAAAHVVVVCQTGAASRRGARRPDCAVVAAALRSSKAVGRGVLVRQLRGGYAQQTFLSRRLLGSYDGVSGLRYRATAKAGVVVLRATPGNQPDGVDVAFSLHRSPVRRLTARHMFAEELRRFHAKQWDPPDLSLIHI